jgi:hypothetical protein
VIMLMNTRARLVMCSAVLGHAGQAACIQMLCVAQVTVTFVLRA